MPWTATLDYDYPDTRTVDDDAWAPAFRAAVQDQRSAVEKIAADDSPAEVANVLHAFALSGSRLRQLEQAFGVLVAADGTEKRQQIRTELAPQLAAHQDWISLHPGLFTRFQQLQQRITSGEVTASAEQQWFLDQQIRKAEVAGADLDPAVQTELKEINQQLALEESAYTQLQLKEAADSPFQLSLFVQQPALAEEQDRQQRRRLFEASVNRGTLAGEDGRTTREIGARIAVLRAQKAQLLGYPNFLESVLPLRTAPSRTAVESMLARIGTGARERAEQEVARINEVLADDLDDPLQPWDLSFGLEKVKATLETESSGGGDLTLDEALERLFDAARRVYGITVVPRPDLPGYVPGAMSFEVFDGSAGEAGSGLGLFLLDLYSRDTKSGGAWMNGFRVPSSLAETKAVVTNNLNLDPVAEGEQTVLSTREQRTLFHEFGHALHALLAVAEFPQLSGTAVPRDNVEFPSQVNEVFQELYRGGPAAGATPSEDELWGKGASTLEHVAAVVIDLAWHTLSPEEAAAAAEDPTGFEQKVLQDWGLDMPMVPPRYHGGFFKHVFAGSGYAAGYYSYLWAQVLAADASEWFREVMQNNDDDALASRGTQFRQELLSRGNTRDPLQSYRAALGRDPDPVALMRSLGLE